MAKDEDMKTKADLPTDDSNRPHNLGSIHAAGMVPMLGLSGGNMTLFVHQPSPGVFSSAWGLGPDALEFIEKHQGRVVVTLVLDLNTKGHPVTMVALQPVNVRTTEDFEKVDKERRPRKKRIITL
jgi:hypothetical protein